MFRLSLSDGRRQAARSALVAEPWAKQLHCPDHDLAAPAGFAEHGHGLIEDVGGHPMVDAVGFFIAEPVVDHRRLAAAPDRREDRPDQTRDGGEVGAIAGGYGDPARFFRAGADGAPVAEGLDQLEWPLGKGASMNLEDEGVGEGTHYVEMTRSKVTPKVGRGTKKLGRKGS